MLSRRTPALTTPLKRGVNESPNAHEGMEIEAQCLFPGTVIISRYAHDDKVCQADGANASTGIPRITAALRSPSGARTPRPRVCKGAEFARTRPPRSLPTSEFQTCLLRECLDIRHMFAS